MGHWQAKSDLKFMRGFRLAVSRLWEIEDQASESLPQGTGGTPATYQRVLQEAAAEVSGYEKARREVAKGAIRATKIARSLRVPIDLKSYPPGGLSYPVVSVSLLTGILQDSSYVGIPRQQIVDALDQTQGGCESRVELEWKRLFNPFYWVKVALVFVIRIPFMLVQASGFDVSKVEDHVISRLFKLAEIGGILYLLYKLGLEKSAAGQAMIEVLKR